MAHAEYNTRMAAKRTRSKHPAAKRVSASHPEATGLPPVVASLRGILKKADPEAYRKHLIKKYL